MIDTELREIDGGELLDLFEEEIDASIRARAFYLAFQVFIFLFLVAVVVEVVT